MSDHIDRQNRVTLCWLEWRRKLPYVPTLQEQLAFCFQLPYRRGLTSAPLRAKKAANSKRPKQVAHMRRLSAKYRHLAHAAAKEQRSHSFHRAVAAENSPPAFLDKTRPCKNCGREFNAIGTRAKKFCSLNCFHKHTFPDSPPPAYCVSCQTVLPRGSWSAARKKGAVRCQSCRRRGASK